MLSHRVWIPMAGMFISGFGFGLTSRPYIQKSFEGTPQASSVKVEAEPPAAEEPPWFIAGNKVREVQFGDRNKTAMVETVQFVTWRDGLYRLTTFRGDQASDGFFQTELIDHPYFPRYVVGDRVKITWNDGRLELKPTK